MDFSPSHFYPSSNTRQSVTKATSRSKAPIALKQSIPHDLLCFSGSTPKRTAKNTANSAQIAKKERLVTSSLGNSGGPSIKTEGIDWDQIPQWPDNNPGSSKQANSPSKKEVPTQEGQSSIPEEMKSNLGGAAEEIAWRVLRFHKVTGKVSVGQNVHNDILNAAIDSTNQQINDHPEYIPGIRSILEERFKVVLLEKDKGNLRSDAQLAQAVKQVFPSLYY